MSRAGPINLSRDSLAIFLSQFEPVTLVQLECSEEAFGVIDAQRGSRVIRINQGAKRLISSNSST